jgi:C4-type Zn-finger protein
MPRWVLSCPYCGAELVHSEIPKDIPLNGVGEAVSSRDPRRSDS